MLRTTPSCERSERRVRPKPEKGSGISSIRSSSQHRDYTGPSHHFGFFSLSLSLSRIPHWKCYQKQDTGNELIVKICLSCFLDKSEPNAGNGFFKVIFFFSIALAAGIKGNIFLSTLIWLDFPKLQWLCFWERQKAKKNATNCRKNCSLLHIGWVCAQVTKGFCCGTVATNYSRVCHSMSSS